MNFYDALKHFQYKATIDRIVFYILDHPKEMEKLMSCFFSEELRICQRASWAVGDLGCKKPELIVPYFSEMLKMLDQPPHNAIIRNVVRIWQVMDIPDEMQGKVFNKCFQYLDDPSEAIAIRAFSMKVCTNIALQYPDLKKELIIVIENHLPNGSSGFKSRAKKMLTLLKKV